MTAQRVVLIVEDDADLRRACRLALTIGGFEVVEAANGLEALHRIDQRTPDVIVLDLGLPALNGFAVHQELTSQALTRSIPIVIVTGSTRDLSHLDVSCVLRKPFTPEELVSAVRACVRESAPPVY